MQVIVDYLPLLLKGLGITLLVSVLGALLCLVVGFTAGIIRSSRNRWVRLPATVFVEVFRGTSMIVQMFWLFFALPFLGFQLTPIAAAVLALGLNEGAYASEVVRAALRATPRGQTEASIALGLSPARRMRRILLPQAIPVMLPGLGNVMVDLVKNTALVSLVTVADLTFNAQLIRSATGETAAIFGTILVMYFLINLVVAGVVRLLERRFSIEPIRRRPLRERLLASSGGAR
ncbi:ectoine/hydroxyectoine ABC transporter permease subunit EhuC [Naumannella sp. ID2617S]|nr:ectoine/hydroxyectoine ABC transporter permease subunit EhuC [Naumannella sp. ID2617S]